MVPRRETLDELPSSKLGRQARALIFGAASAFYLKHPGRKLVQPYDNGQRKNFSRLARGFMLFVLLATNLVAMPARAADAPSEAQVKAAFLLNFPKYVEWPATVFPETNSPIVVAILGQDSVAAEFAAMSEKKVVEGHPIHLVRVDSIDQCRDCHILFVGSDGDRKLTEVFQKLHGRNILTVGETDDFIDQGGMIQLARHDRRITLEVDMNPVRQAGLKVSSKLLSVATVKGGRK